MNEEVKSALHEYLQGFLKTLGENAEIQFKQETSDEIHVNLQGLVALDGIDPKPLRSLSYLAEISLRRKLNQGVRIQLDVNGGQQRRQLDLRRMAESAAQRALLEGKVITLDPMETHERKLIHEVLSQIPGVRTHSEGQGEERRVVVEPASGVETPGDPETHQS
jgi:spoIIIJ-associated protein